MDNGHDNNAPQPSDANATLQPNAQGAQQPLETPAQPNASQPVAPQPSSPQADTEQPAAPQGIFSSGDLAVNSENLDTIKPELSAENKSRIASAFAQTDATRQHDQLSDQMADQDAISGTVLPASANGGFGSNTTASSATGDIRIPGMKKKSKLPLLALAAVVVLAVVAGVWFVMRNSGGGSEETLQALYTSLMDYINNSPDGEYIYDGGTSAPVTVGPPQTDSPDMPVTSENQPPSQDEPDNNEDPFPTQADLNEGDNKSQQFILVADSWLGGEELKNYYDEVSRRYYRFIEKARNSENQIVKATADANYNIFPAVFTVIKRNMIEGDMAKYVYAGDIAGAEKYVGEVLPAESPQEQINTMMSDFSTYLRQSISIYEIYKYDGCLAEDGVDWGCVANSGNNTADYASFEAARYLDDTMAIAENYQMLALSQLSAFARLVENSNE